MRASEGAGVKEHEARGEAQAYDPICGQKVACDGAPSSEYKKKNYFFCSGKCKHEFDRAAERIRMNEVARAGALFTQGKVRWALA